MEFVRPGINIDFIGKRRIAMILSAALVLFSLLAFFVKGPKYGVDFAGGSVIQVRFSGTVTIAAIKEGLRALGIDGATVQNVGEKKDNEFLIRTEIPPGQAGAFDTELRSRLASATGQEVEIRRVETVGPQVGTDLREKALLAMFFALIFIAIYISGRFEFKWWQSAVVAAGLGSGVYAVYTFGFSLIVLIWVALVGTLILFWVLGLKYALGAILALVHDVSITIGLFTLLEKEFTLPVVAALLTIIGYSLNDTIVIFDRIRENLRKLSRSPLAEIINRSVNETLSRTILTAGTTLLVVVALFFLGGEIIHDFAFALLVGIIVGTYSSIYVASPIVLAWEERARK
ncbi:MAG: protein translocase subunit SecF [Desulfobacterales bacterium]